MNTIDLRSDTVTHPTPEMREAMAGAPVGDDVYGEDPTINRLEAMAAEMLGKAAALFVTSGTQGNLVSIFAQAARGDEIIVAENSHIFMSEGGGPAALGGIQSRPLPVLEDGTFPLNAIESVIRADNPHYPRTSVVCLENTQAGVGGQPLPTAYIDAVGTLCDQHNLKLHIDGARLFNASVALNENPADLVRAADSVSFCLSKGLCVPLGSIIVGSEDFIHECRRVRKTMGGGLRQAGIIAAAGIIALETMIDRLAEDHETACILAEGLSAISTVELVNRVSTNFVNWRLLPDAPLSPQQLIEKLAEDKIIARLPRDGIWRFVTHYWITPQDAAFVVERMRSYLS